MQLKVFRNVRFAANVSLGIQSILSTSFFNYDGTTYKNSDNIAPVLVPSLIGATLLVLLSWFAWYQWRLYRLSKSTAGSHALA